MREGGYNIYILKILLKKENLKAEHSKLIDEKNKKVRKLEDELSGLKSERSSLGFPNIGKDLEIWCDNKFKEAHLEERNNIVWERYSDSGNRADYVYKVYATDEKKENELLVLQH